MKAVILTVAMTVLIAACTSSEPLTTTVVPTTTPAGDAASPATTTATGTDTTASTTAVTEPPTTSSSMPVPEGPPYIEGIDLPAVVLLTAPSGGGERPLLEWDSVQGAAWYQVIVISPSGDTYWNWPTEDTSVFVSGVESTNTRAPGPRVSAGMSWAVLAFDDVNLLIAQSRRRPIEP